jgi:hypothetical protein
MSIADVDGDGVINYSEFADIDGCAGPAYCLGLANSNGTCLDVAAPGTGYTCAGDAGYWWNGAACEGCARAV